MTALISALVDAVSDAARAHVGWQITLTVTPLHDDATQQPTPSRPTPGRARDDGHEPRPAATAVSAGREHPAVVLRRLADADAPPQTGRAWARAVPGLSARALGRAVTERVLAATPRGASRGHRARLIRAVDLAEFVRVCDLIETGRIEAPAWYDRVVRPR
jgi:hypothetical protein